MELITTVPDTASLDRFCTLSGMGELTPQQVRRHQPDLLLMVERSGLVAARLSLWWRHVPDYPGERIGLLGHYAANDEEAAVAILHEACHLLAQHGATLAVGPMDGNTWRRYRLLSERGSEPCFFLEPDNPDAWPGHFKSAGFAPFALYYSALDEDISRPWPVEPAAQGGITMRPFDLSHSEEELQRLWNVARVAFADNLLYSPIEQQEFHELYRPFVSKLRPELVQLAEEQGRVVAFCFAIPDLQQQWRGVEVDTVIIKSIAVLPEYRRRGLATQLIARVRQMAAQLGMRRAILALMHEANYSRRIAHHATLRDFRRYTLYARRL